MTGRLRGERELRRHRRPPVRGRRAARDHEALPGRRRERRRRLRGGARARCTRCSARTAPARRRCRTSSPGSTGRTRARSSSTASRCDFHSPRDALDAGICDGAPALPARRRRSPSRRTSSSAITATTGGRSSLHPRAIERARRRARRALRARRRPARADLAALGRRAAARRDPEGALPRCADPDPRRADRGADAAGGRRAVRDAARDGGRGPDGDLHLAQAARGDGGRRPGHRPARAGARSATVATADATPRSLAALMVGREVDARRGRRDARREPGEPVLELDGRLRSRATAATPALRGVSLDRARAARSSASPGSRATASASSPRRSPGMRPRRARARSRVGGRALRGGDPRAAIARRRRARPRGPARHRRRAEPQRRARTSCSSRTASRPCRAGPLLRLRRIRELARAR